MSELVLITGGAGFVGSHLADRLLRERYRVRVLDSLTEQVHGASGWPGYLGGRVERVRGDVRDPGAVRAALQGVAAVYHFAAAVGVGQSMYQVEYYTDVNNRGTAVLLEALAEHRVRKLVVASSMSVYGEGLYRDPSGALCSPPARDPKALRAGSWDPRTGEQRLEPVATPETKEPHPTSVYALSKYDQERLCLLVGASLGIPTAALRFFKVYGPRQALSNPYTGVLAIFSARLLNGKPPVVFEDGHQRRDFVSVHDVVEACVLALQSDQSDGEVFNIGSGENYRVVEVAESVARALGVTHVEPEITGAYRVGDIRHCFGDITKAQELLRYRPRVSLSDGLEELAEWLKGQRAEDRVEQMRSELVRRGLSS